MEAGGPVIARMKAGYLNLIRDASIDRQNSNDFFGPGGEPWVHQLYRVQHRRQFRDYSDGVPAVG